jgi:hypothetical protein
MDECAIIRKNIALRLVIKYSPSKEKSACKEVDTYKVDGTAFLVSVGEPKADHRTRSLTRTRLRLSSQQDARL